MTFKERLNLWIVQIFLERPAKNQGLEQLSHKLVKTGQELRLKFAGKAASEANQKTLSHIIAIERWGQSRLKVALGEAFKQDESHSYKPSAETSWQDLQGLFEKTRAETVAIAQSIAQAKLDPQQTLTHNQFGPISLLAWLRYLNVHAALEAKRIR